MKSHRTSRRLDVVGAIPLLTLLMLPAAAQAQFKHTVSNGGITVTGYTGPGGVVTISNTIEGLPVTGIAEGAFLRCTSLNLITMPDTVTTIGEGAFIGCTNLTSITIPDSVITVGDGAFAGCASLTNATIGNGVASIGEGAFYGCTSLRAVHFRGTPPQLGKDVFSGGNATLYYLPGRAGWTTSLAGLPTALWQAETQTSNANVAPRTNPPAATTAPTVAKTLEPPRLRVTPIAWSTFRRGTAAGLTAQQFGRVLLNANRHALTTWWTAHGFDQAPADRHLSLGGTGEHDVRPVASQAQGLAVSLQTGLYHARVTGVPETEARTRTVRLVGTLARHHRANSSGGWGGQWQSPRWAASTALAGWLMWDELNDETRRDLLAMIESEVEWVMSNKGKPTIKFYRDRAGQVLYPGDSGSAENGWDADILNAATAMIPDHPGRTQRRHKAIELMLSTGARPSDVERTNVIHGQPLSRWLSGSNLNEDGTLVDHDRVHPDYMVSGLFEFTPMVWYGLARRSAPLAATFNIDVIYGALARVSFSVGQTVEGRTVLPPGGTVFKAGSASIYYPHGNDWGEKRYLHFALADAVIAAFSKDPELKRMAVAWEPMRLEAVLKMQARFPDGHTFAGESEEPYLGREEWIADEASRAYLLKWLLEQDAIRITDGEF